MTTPLWVPVAIVLWVATSIWRFSDRAWAARVKIDRIHGLAFASPPA